jgi:hypothetical protein
MTANSVPSVRHQSNLDEPIIDFVGARRRAQKTSERVGQENKIDRQIHKAAFGRNHSSWLANALEEAFYWMVSAAAVVYLALLFLGR